MFDFSAYEPSKAEAEEADETTELFKGNKWVTHYVETARIARYRRHLKQIRDKHGPRKAMQHARAIARRDKYYLAHQLLGFKDLHEPLHGDLFDFMAHCDAHGFSTLTELPRSHYKSSLATTTRAIGWMIEDPMVTIGLGSATLKDCRAFARDIRGRLEKTDVRLVFPDIFWTDAKRATEKWTEEEFTIKRPSFSREATVTAFGVEEDMPTGKHFRKILLDDVVNKENIRTPERMEKVHDNLNLIPPLLVTPDMPIHFVGTPYHLRDYYAKLEGLKSVKCYIRPALEGGKPIFPTKFNKQVLEDLRVKFGNYLFNTQYMMLRQDDADKRFRLEWLKYDETPILPGQEGYNFFLSVDPANARRKDSDFTAMGVFAVDHLSRMHLVDGLHDKLSPAQRIDAVFRFARKWKILYCSYETIGFQATDAFWINRQMYERNYFFPIFEVAQHKERKDDRIMGVQPIMQAGAFFFPAAGIPYERQWENPDDALGKNIDVCDVAKREMEHYPMGDHDDILDMFAQARAIVVAGVIPTPEPPKRFEVQTAYGKPVKKDSYNPLAH